MLFDLYSNLIRTAPLDRIHLYGSRTGEGRAVWLAITTQGFPCLAVPARDDDFRADIALHSIDVEFSRGCEIVANHEGGRVTGTYTVVRLNDAEPDTVRLVLRLLEEAFCRTSEVLDNRLVGDKILEIAELFRRLESVTGDLVGLWGELYLIAESGNVLSAVRSWCSHKEAKYDFVSCDFALEVKTTVKPTRQHRFSIEQLRPAGDFQVFVASLQVIEVPSGRSVPEMMELVLGHLHDGDLRHAFLHRCVSKGGADLYRSTLTLQCLPGGGSLTLLRAKDIPVPTIAVGDPISQVRFDVDLSRVSPVNGDLADSVLSFRDGSAA